MATYRSSLRLFVYGLAGVFLIAAAADVMFGFWLSVPPDSVNGSLTTRGLAQQRGDLLWGGAMLVVGVLVFGAAFTDLVRNRPAVAVRSGGIRLATAASDAELIPWERVQSVTSRVTVDPYDGGKREHLVMRLVPGTEIGPSVTDVVRDGDTIWVDAHAWGSSASDVALAANGSLDLYRRSEALRSFEPPSMTWETSSDVVSPGSLSEDEVRALDDDARIGGQEDEVDPVEEGEDE